jgi:hypothetical protein
MIRTDVSRVHDDFRHEARFKNANFPETLRGARLLVKVENETFGFPILIP